MNSALHGIVLSHGHDGRLLVVVILGEPGDVHGSGPHGEGEDDDRLHLGCRDGLGW